jgi:hypothetical protein
MRRNPFPTVENMMRAFSDNYANDPNTKINNHDGVVVISWAHDGNFKRGEGTTLKTAIAEFYDVEMPPSPDENSYAALQRPTENPFLNEFASVDLNDNQVDTLLEMGIVPAQLRSRRGCAFFLTLGQAAEIGIDVDAAFVAYR